MTERTSFYHKLGYLAGIVVLAFPIVWLSVPSTTTRAGGKLAQLRNEYKLSQVNLGEVDPASETIKLATLGLRGVAVNLLWEQANYYKKTEDWTNLTATLEQLAKLQPNFITFWKFQAWNLTYNVSVEFDDYHDRYYYVRRGIQFLKEGERYNVGHPQLLWDLGWFIGQKIGRADEYVQYRKLFKADDEFHPADRTPEERDNWLVGKEWYEKAIDSVDNKGRSLGRKSPRDFYSSPAKSEMNYAEAIEEEGAFERARLAWMKAAEEWRQFGNTFIEHSTGVKLQLGSQSRLEKELADLRAKLEGMLPNVRATLVQEKRAALTPEERALLDTPKQLLTPEQADKRYHIAPKVEVSDREVAERIAREQPANQNQALQLASEIERQDRVLQFTINYKRDANYDYWKTRADFEQTKNALDARKLMFDGRKAFREADLPKAKKAYQEGFAKWRAVIDEYPSILDDDQTTGGDIVDFIKRYRSVLDQLDEKLGDDFPLWDVLEKFDREGEFTAELKDRRERHGKPADSTAKPEPAAAEPAPAAKEPSPEPSADNTSKPTPKPATKSAEKSALSPTPAKPSKKPAAATTDSSKK
ncbi:MAG TPA: hypothetical protein VHU84_03040 [Lacipirellulaceae bacterium]|nr:hypothetical protein [Lacipirellulaceae bacterium]